MTRSKSLASQILYFLPIVVITELVLVGGAALVLIASGQLFNLPFQVFGYLFAFKTLIAAITLVIAARLEPRRPQVELARGGGLILGHTVGLLLGGFLGSQLGGYVGCALGIVGLYLLGGRAGAALSKSIALAFERLLSRAAELENIRGE